MSMLTPDLRDLVSEEHEYRKLLKLVDQTAHALRRNICGIRQQSAFRELDKSDLWGPNAGFGL